MRYNPMRKFISPSGLLIAFVFLCGFSELRPEPPFRNGDLIFIVNPSGQGKSIQLATKSKFTHVGIIFIENGKAMVYHAVEPVSKDPVEEFIALSADGKYELKRLRLQEKLTAEVIDRMQAEANASLGLHYDLAFNWDDERLYCSEFVWKLYHKTLDVQIGAPRTLKDFDLSHPVVKARLAERYGKNIPLGEKMISPGDMYESPLLE
jgi:hypothetical protein